MSTHFVRPSETAGSMTAFLTEMAADPHGWFSSSVYETGRLVRHRPSLTGHAERLLYLLDQQQRDGGWGGPGEYGLVPTLSATESLLTVLHHESDVLRDRVTIAAERGLRTLSGRLNQGKVLSLPDTVAVEIVVPGLISDINSHLGSAPINGLRSWYGRRLLPHPEADDKSLARIRAAAAAGATPPTKLLHSLEVLGDAAPHSIVRPVRGCVGCSPAATAAWLGGGAVGARRRRSLRYLEGVQERCGGPVPVATPLSGFERAWVLSSLAGAGLPLAVDPGLPRGLHAAFGEHGMAAGPGLPPDADDTATALCALARLGSARSPDCLWAYREPDGHFACFPAERTPSTTTNAHVLQAFDACLAAGLPPRPDHTAAMATLSGWLCDQQEADGTWQDKWHASPYYATVCCAQALAGHGGGAAGPALRRAVRWVLDTQRADGSWGRWAGTHEETAYAVQVLCRVAPPGDHVDRAIARGCAVLLRHAGSAHPPLWHDKDLYTPVRIVRAEGLAALHLARANPRVAALLDEPHAGGRPAGEES